MSCNSNTLFINRPSKNNSSQGICNTSCSTSLGIADYVDVKISARPKREKVREQIKDYVLAMLGAPLQKIELTDQMLDIAIDSALDVFEDYAPREYFEYYTFDTVPGKSVYTMPPDVGIIRNVFYKQQGTFAFQASDLGGALPIEYFYPGGAYASIQGGLIDPIQPIWGRMGEWVLYKQYEQMYSKVASNIGGWEFVGGIGNIKIYPIPFRVHKVIVHFLKKHPDLNKSTQIMRDGALSFAKEMVGRVRGKFQSPPGQVQLDWQQLLQEAKDERKKFEEDLLNRYGDILVISTG